MAEKLTAEELIRLRAAADNCDLLGCATEVGLLLDELSDARAKIRELEDRAESHGPSLRGSLEISTLVDLQRRVERIESTLLSRSPPLTKSCVSTAQAESAIGWAKGQWMNEREPNALTFVAIYQEWSAAMLEKQLLGNSDGED